jgi:hypothetical protein
VLAFEESATGAETTVNKVWILSQECALDKVAQGGVTEGRAKIAVGGVVELVQAERGGEESEPRRVIGYHSIRLRAAVLECGV